MELKDILKQLKLNESKLSTLLGALVILIIGFMIFNYFRNIQQGSTTSTSTEDNQQNQTVKHVVEAGESLSAIAREYYGNPNLWTAIADANNVSDSNSLEVGQELIIPEVSPEPETIAPVQSPQPTEVPSITSATTYTVERGDSLWSIAQEVYGDPYEWTKIADANNLSNPNLIHPGNVFSIPR